MLACLDIRFVAVLATTVISLVEAGIPEACAQDVAMTGNEISDHGRESAGAVDGYAITVFKSSRRLYLVRDGEIVTGVKVKKSTLDRRLFGFLEGTAEDEIVVDFPIPVAVSALSGHRTWKWDKKTPEGAYRVCSKDDRAHTHNTVALALDYPNLADATAAYGKHRISREEFLRIGDNLRRGICPPYTTYLGGYIKIHGPKDARVAVWREEGVLMCNRGSGCDKVSWNEFRRLENPYANTVLHDRDSLGCVVTELSAIFYLYEVVPVGTPVFIYP